MQTPCSSGSQLAYGFGTTFVHIFFLLSVLSLCYQCGGGDTHIAPITDRDRSQAAKQLEGVDLSVNAEGNTTVSDALQLDEQMLADLSGQTPSGPLTIEPVSITMGEESYTLKDETLNQITNPIFVLYYPSPVTIQSRDPGAFKANWRVEFSGLDLTIVYYIVGFELQAYQEEYGDELVQEIQEQGMDYFMGMIQDTYQLSWEGEPTTFSASTKRHHLADHGVFRYGRKIDHANKEQLFLLQVMQKDEWERGVAALVLITGPKGVLYNPESFGEEDSEDAAQDSQEREQKIRDLMSRLLRNLFFTIHDTNEDETAPTEEPTAPSSSESSSSSASPSVEELGSP